MKNEHEMRAKAIQDKSEQGINQKDINIHTIILSICLFTLIIFWEKFTLFGYPMPFHVVVIPIGVGYILINWRDFFLFDLIIILFTIYFINLLLFAVTSVEFNSSFALRTLYTFVLIIILANIFHIQMKSDNNALPNAAIIAIILFALYVKKSESAVDFSIGDVIRYFLSLEFRMAESEWRKILSVNPEYLAGGDVSNLRNGFASVLFAITAIILWTTSNSVMRGFAFMLAIIMLSLTSFSGAILIITVFFIYYARPSVALIVALIVIVLFAVSCTELISSGSENEFLHNRILGTTVDRFEHLVISWEDIKISRYSGYYPGYKINTSYGTLYPHNMIAALWLNTGILGAIIFTIIYAIIMVRFLIVFKKIKLNSHADKLYILSSIITLNFLLRSMVSGPAAEFADFGSIIAIALHIAVRRRHIDVLTTNVATSNGVKTYTELRSGTG